VADQLDLDAHWCIQEGKECKCQQLHTAQVAAQETAPVVVCNSNEQQQQQQRVLSVSTKGQLCKQQLLRLLPRKPRQ
jgi:hypothetical protein